MKVINIYEQLTPKQREKIGDKKSFAIYYEWIEQLTLIGLSYEKIGVLFSALAHYTRTNGTEPLPEDIENEIDSDMVLKILFDTYMRTTIEATKIWCNTHHKSKKDTENDTEAKDSIKPLKDNKNDFKGITASHSNNPDDLPFSDETENTNYGDIVVMSREYKTAGMTIGEIDKINSQWLYDFTDIEPQNEIEKKDQDNIKRYFGIE